MFFFLLKLIYSGDFSIKIVYCFDVPDSCGSNVNLCVALMSKAHLTPLDRIDHRVYKTRRHTHTEKRESLTTKITSNHKAVHKVNLLHSIFAKAKAQWTLLCTPPTISLDSDNQPFCLLPHNTILPRNAQVVTHRMQETRSTIERNMAVLIAEEYEENKLC